jgi:hypothetical protein
MKHAVGDMVVLDEIKNLSFVYVSRVGQGVKDPVRIQREILPVPGENHFFIGSSEGTPAQAGERGEPLFLLLVKLGLQVSEANRFIQRNQSPYK